MMGYFVKPGRAVILACAENLGGGRIISDWDKERGRLISDGFSQVGEDEYDIVHLVEVYGAARVIEIATKYAETES